VGCSSCKVNDHTHNSPPSDKLHATKRTCLFSKYSIVSSIIFGTVNRKISVSLSFQNADNNHHVISFDATLLVRPCTNECLHLFCSLYAGTTRVMSTNGWEVMEGKGCRFSVSGSMKLFSDSVRCRSGSLLVVNLRNTYTCTQQEEEP